MSIDLEEFLEGQRFLNDETRKCSARGYFVYRKWWIQRVQLYWNWPCSNDHYQTSEASYVAREAIWIFKEHEAFPSNLQEITSVW